MWSGSYPQTQMLKPDSRLTVMILGSVLLLLKSTIVSAQSQALLHIKSNDMDAAVYADSSYLGPVHGSPYWVDPMSSTITLSTLRASTWNVSPIQTFFNAEPGDSVHVTLNFPTYHRIESHPFGAEAWLQRGSERKLLGLTPLVFHSVNTQDGMFHIEMEGYNPGIVKPKTDLWNRYEVSLTALDQVNRQSATSRTVKHQRRWIDWGAAAVAVVAGAVAVHYKFRADRINDEYLETGNASLRPRVAKLDDYSGIALGVMQAGLVTLAVRFALE